MRKLEHVVFVGFWGVNDPLTIASLIPTIELFRRKGYADSITLATVERDDLQGIHSPISGVDHVPLFASRAALKSMARGLDIVSLPLQLKRALRGKRVSLFIARGTPAGQIPSSIAMFSRTPVIIESVEPHTEYMVQSGEWGAHSISARVGSRLEQFVLRNAQGIITVSERYAARLRQEGLSPERITTVPCTVDLGRFRFCEDERQKVRSMLGWQNDALVGVYLGKFGGMYHDELAFRALAEFLLRYPGNGRLLVLSPSDHEQIKAGLHRYGATLEHVHVLRVPHDQVPAYLSAGDLAFALYKGTPSSLYLSPVKNGEYWANGLPVIMTRGVADDSALIEQAAEAGALFDPVGDDLKFALDKVRDTLKVTGQRSLTMAFAEKHRSRERLDVAFRYLLQRLG
jgi:hypothetical protein